jgi:hypothetical protein
MRQPRLLGTLQGLLVTTPQAGRRAMAPRPPESPGASGTGRLSRLLRVGPLPLAPRPAGQARRRPGPGATRLPRAGRQSAIMGQRLPQNTKPTRLVLVPAVPARPCRATCTRPLALARAPGLCQFTTRRLLARPLETWVAPTMPVTWKAPTMPLTDAPKSAAQLDRGALRFGQCLET